MALSSSQIYVATYSTGAEKMNTTSNARKETAHTSRWRFGRSTTNLRDSDSRASGRTSSTRRDASPPPTEPKVERSASKMSLFSLFSKPKVERARGHTEVGLAAEVLRERMDSVRDLSIIEEDGSEAKRLEKTHKRLISNSVLNPPAPDLVNKIYILVTAGYVLQYADDGSFDRKPEKVLKLGKESAAFACDLIPGKHWVLQISSHAHDDGTPETGPKNSLISRLRTQNAAVKKAATSFLLVLDSAEEMDAWMTVVRKEIENQGGMKVRAESSRASSSTDDTRETRSSDTTSHRYRVQRDSTAPSKIVPIDSPLQSQYSSPKIVTSEWASNRSPYVPCTIPSRAITTCKGYFFDAVLRTKQANFEPTGACAYPKSATLIQRFERTHPRVI
ncbi:hypothetical protein SNOG_05911 [Parastagonospora nodorum SN15]|uniref:PH domain-containing protein n=1 Tax=Phaeosphaeria nodorum (strain SN15 / ATCC MYA-4574 / FGSC 10173) TaxID=321614 RepID=Q0UQQ3_PHANO|nr:hypothetical protein SNOG_05911 [Parastagonospora nodorum SN15]EAT86975.2 hypothetical protein SNOG_05911 [Parastagonospora nodorum SN15]